MKATATAEQLADFARQHIGDKSAPITVYRGNAPADWRLELLISDVRHTETRIRLAEAERLLRAQFDLRASWDAD
jgi:hypothetical protein